MNILKKIRENKLASNMVYQMCYQGLALVYPLITTPVISKAFGAEVFGIYSYTYTIAYYFSLIAALGIQTHGSRLIAIYRDSKEQMRKTFWELYFVQLLCSLLSFILYAIFVILNEKVYADVSMAQGIIILTAMVDISWFFTGLEQFKTMVLRNFMIKILSLVLIFTIIHSKEDLLLYVFIMAGTNLLGQLSIWPAAISKVGCPRFSWKGSQKHMPTVLKLFLPVLALNSYALVDKTLLGLFRSMNEVGWYENTDKIIRMPINFVNAAGAVMLPRASYNISRGGDKENNEMVRRTLEFACMLIIPLIFGLIAIAEELVPWYMGDSFLPCIQYIKILSPVIFFMTISNILRMQFFIPHQMDRIYITSIVMAAAVNIFLSISLVESHGIDGVVFATICSEAVGAIFLVVNSWNNVEYIKLVPWLIVYVLCAIPMYLLVRQVGYMLGSSVISTFLQVILGMIVYMFEILIVYLLSGKKHIQFLKK